jgi:hypothetical protein
VSSLVSASAEGVRAATDPFSHFAASTPLGEEGRRRAGHADSRYVGTSLAGITASIRANVTIGG